VWYPADVAGRDTPPRHSRWHLVLVAHGSCGFRTNYEYLTVPLASRGFLVAAPDFPGFNKTDCDDHVPPGDIFRHPPADLVFLRTAFHDRSGADRPTSWRMRCAGSTRGSSATRSAGRPS
jgi:predicted dienelactone hydrolase